MDCWISGWSVLKEPIKILNFVWFTYSVRGIEKEKRKYIYSRPKMIVHKIGTYAMRMKTWTWLCTKCWRFFSFKCFHFHTLEISAFTTEKLDEWLRYTFVPLLYSIIIVTMYFLLPNHFVLRRPLTWKNPILYNWKSLAPSY